MSKGHSLQDPYLNTLRKEKVGVSIYLVNGIKLQGTIESFDQFVILLKNTVSQMVYKHAISTVVPVRPIRLPSATENEQGELGQRRVTPDRSLLCSLSATVVVSESSSFTWMDRTLRRAKIRRSFRNWLIRRAPRPLRFLTCRVIGQPPDS